MRWYPVAAQLSHGGTVARCHDRLVFCHRLGRLTFRFENCMLCVARRMRCLPSGTGKLAVSDTDPVAAVNDRNNVSLLEFELVGA